MDFVDERCRQIVMKHSKAKLTFREKYIHLYSVFQGFSKAKSAICGSILSSSQFLILPQLPQKIKLASKVVKVD
jgi:hypothetical protein